MGQVVSHTMGQVASYARGSEPSRNDENRTTETKTDDDDDDSLSTTSSSSDSCEDGASSLVQSEPIPMPAPKVTAELVGDNEVADISRKLLFENFLPLGRRLDVDEQILDDIERECRALRQGSKEMFYQLFRKWKEMMGNDARKQDVVDALLKIQRKDVVDDVFSGISYTSTRASWFSRFGLQDLLAYRTSPDTSTVIQQKQREFYQRLTIPSVSWLKRTLHLRQIYIDQQLYYMEEKDLKPKKCNRLANIFEGSSRRILICGPSKCGKTTLLARLLYDWSMYETYMSSKFDYVFVIPLRNFHQDVTKTIFNQCDVDVDVAQKQKTVFASAHKVLLILDGLEEMSSKVRKQLEKTLKDPKYASVTILVTCRELKQPYRNRLASIAEKPPALYDQWDKQAWPSRIILGEVSRSKLPEKYLGKAGATVAGKRSSKHSDTDSDSDSESTDSAGDTASKCPTDILHAPLMYVFFSLFTGKTDMKSSLPNKSELYQKMCSFLAQCAVANRERDEPSLNLFDPRCKLYDSFLKLGETSYDKLKRHSLVYEEDEIARHFSKRHRDIAFAFFTRPVVFFKQTNVVYEPLYEGFVELFAAHYLSTFREDELRPELEQLLLCQIPLENTGFLLTFLATFLGDKAYHVFQVLRPFLCATIGNDSQLDDIVSGVLMTDRNLSAVAPYMLPVWSNVDLDVYPRIECLHYGIRHGFVHRVKLDSETFWKYLSIFPDAEIPEVMIDATYAIPPAQTSSKTLSCCTLHLKMNSNGDRQTWDNLMMILKSVRYKRLVFQISSYDRNRERLGAEDADANDLLLEWLPRLKVSQLMLLLLSKGEFFELMPILEDMLDNGKIENGLRIDVDGCVIYDERMQVLSLMNKVTASGLRNVFFNDNYKCQLSSSVLTSGNKDWDYIYFTESLETEEGAEQKQVDNVIGHLDCRGFRESAAKEKLFRFSNVRRISCFDGFLEALQDLPANWDGFRTVREIDILRFKDDLKVQRFQNLARLNVEFSFIFDRNKEDAIVGKLLDIIGSLPLKALALQRTNVNNIAFIVNFLNRVAESKALRLEEIFIEFNGQVDLGKKNRPFLDAINGCFAEHKMKKCFLLFYTASPTANVRAIWDYSRSRGKPFDVRYEPYVSDTFKLHDVHHVVYQSDRYYICLHDNAEAVV